MGERLLPYGEDFIAMAEGLLNSFLGALGQNARDLLDAWQASNREGVVGIYPCKNFNRMNLLEVMRGRITCFLTLECGIKDFARYPPEILIKQYDERENDKKPYGIVIRPREDSNGAFYDTWGLLRGLFEQLGDWYLI